MIIFLNRTCHTSARFFFVHKRRAGFCRAKLRLGNFSMSKMSPSSPRREEEPTPPPLPPSPVKNLRAPTGIIATLKSWRYLYELWTGLYMLEFWEKCLFGAFTARTKSHLSYRIVYFSLALALTLMLSGPSLHLKLADGLVSLVLILLAYGAWRLTSPVLAVIVL